MKIAEIWRYPVKTMGGDLGTSPRPSVHQGFAVRAQRALVGEEARVAA
jgi:hypothetical protein